MNDTPLTAPEVAATLRCSESFVYYLFRTKRLGGYRLGKSVRIWQSSVEAYLREQTQQAVKPVKTPPAVKKARRSVRSPVGYYELQFLRRGKRT